jgi:hypothetical protein
LAASRQGCYGTDATCGLSSGLLGTDWLPSEGVAITSASSLIVSPSRCEVWHIYQQMSFLPLTMLSLTVHFVFKIPTAIAVMMQAPPGIISQPFPADSKEVPLEITESEVFQKLGQELVGSIANYVSS